MIIGYRVPSANGPTDFQAPHPNRLPTYEADAIAFLTQSDDVNLENRIFVPVSSGLPHLTRHT
jgi:hypothetical protein